MNGFYKIFTNIKSMQDHAEKSQNIKNQSLSQAGQPQLAGLESPVQLIDNRPESVFNRKIQGIADTSSRSVQLKAMDTLINTSQKAQKVGRIQEKSTAVGTPNQEKGKPITQLKSTDSSTAIAEESFAINDQASLEQEADVMGEKAMKGFESFSNEFSKPIAPNNKGSIQLKKTDSLTAEGLRKKSQKEEQTELESLANPAADKEKLKGLQTKGVAMGESAQVGLQGDLTLSAKVNRFLGSESTYSKLLRKSEEFNKATDVVLKQTILKELKPLARTWLVRHAESEGKNDPNEELKRASVQRFLDQTTSNFPVVKDKYAQLQTKMEVVVGDPLSQQPLFHQAVEDYAGLQSMVESYKAKYPPAVNLLYINEIEEIQLAEKNLIKTWNKTGPSYDTGLGFSISDPDVNLDLTSGSFWLSGSLELTLLGSLSASGNVKAEFASDGSFKNISVSEGSCKIEINGVVIDITSFMYDFGSNQFVAQEANGSFEILGNPITIKALGAVIKEGKVSYKSLEGSIQGVIDTKLGLVASNPWVKYIPEVGIEVKGELGLTISDFANASGIVGLKFGVMRDLQDITIEEGAGEASLGGFNLKLQGLAYAYAEKKFSVAEAKGEISIFDKVLALNGFGITIQNNAFDYEKIEGKLPTVDYGFFSLKETSISYEKNKKAFEGKTSYQFNTSQSPEGFTEFQSSGEVLVHWSPTGEKYYSIDNGNLKFNLFDQQAQIDKFSYNSQDATLNAESFAVNVDLLNFKKTFAGQGIEVGSQGINFEELKTEASGVPFDMKVFTLTPKAYSLTKDATEGLRVNALGALALNLPEYFGIKTKGEIEGYVGIGFTDPTPSYEITSGSAEVSMPNPLNKLGEILGDDWSNGRFELSAAIPVFPAISAIFGIYLEYGARFPKELMATIKLNKESDSINLKAGLETPISVEAGVFGGVQGGSELLLALAILLRAAGVFEMQSMVGYSKNFELGKQPANKKFAEDEGLIYSLTGEAKVQASLDLVATALYFFRKRFRLALGEKSLGSFEYSNEKHQNPVMGDTALADKSLLEGQIDPALREEANGLTLEQLLDFDSNHRFTEEGKKESIKLIKNVEQEREEIHESEKSDPAKAKIFNNVPLANLQFFNKFIDKRCNWDEIYRVVDVLGESLMSKNELASLPDEEKTRYLQETVLSNIQSLGESTNIAQVFVAHYHKKVEAFALAYPGPVGESYRRLLEQKGNLLQSVQEMKQGYLHSSFWGDEKKQMQNLKTGAWFSRKSKYERFAEAYRDFRVVVLNRRSILTDVEVLGKETAFKLVQEHQRSIENED